MLIKIHKSYRNVVALADKELLNKKFEEKNKQLNLTTGFYNGKEISEKDAIQQLQNQANEDATFNIIGEKSIQTAKKAGIISPEQISKIQNIPFALVLL